MVLIFAPRGVPADAPARRVTNPYWYKALLKYGVKVNGKEAFTATCCIDFSFQAEAISV